MRHTGKELGEREMNCAEFQRVLPDIIETGGNAEQEAHLKSCQVCSDLVADLRYIADAAKLLVPMEDPSPKVWDGIERALEKEGLVRPAGPGRRLLRSNKWGTVPWFSVVLAIATVLGVIAIYQQRASRLEARSTAAVVDVQEDAQLLSAVSEVSPDLRSTYEQNLRAVNEYISDAKLQVEQNPADSDARDLLMRAYEQKAMIYEMAMDHSLR